ncbi:MAG: DNA mismatch repair protein MutL, partial [Bacteroidales bacterium]|nr:DNA mismatch repair protein MutL [Bacteroidales bacterium]
VHPTKTEIKFEDDRAIWQVIFAAVRESLGRHNVVPSIDFDQSGSIDIPVRSKETGEIQYPEIKVNRDYNPFETEKTPSFKLPKTAKTEKSNLNRWEDLYQGAQLILKSEDETSPAPGFSETAKSSEGFSRKKILQLKQKYILSPVKSGLMVIDQKRAHERILFEQFMEVLKSDSVASQQQLFPQTIELDAGDAELLKNILDDLLALGFDIREFGKNTFIINGTPGVLDVSSPEIIVEKLLEEYKNSPVDAKAKAKEQVAISLAKASALDYGTELRQEEIDHLIDNLFACATPNYSPEGKKVLTIIPLEDIEKTFNK